MARIRSIKPEAFTSETLSRLDYFTRWTFAGLWTYFDDHGYGRADPRLIRSALFPLDDDATVGKVAKAVAALEDADCLCRFRVDDRTYLHAPKWTEHQKVNRPTKSKFPPCPAHDNGTDGDVLTPQGELTEGSVSAHGVVTEGSREERNREQGTGRSSSAVADGAFTEFWTTYPRKVGKPDAQRAWAKATKRTDPDTIIAGLRAYLPVWEATEAQFIPHAATWLNGERWTDDVVSRPRKGEPGTSPEASLWAKAREQVRR